MPATRADTSDGYLLEVEHLSKAFKGLLAVDSYSLGLRQGEILGIIGPNGAGKTTVFNLLTGYVRPTGGTIRFSGQDITHRPPAKIATLGIGRTFQRTGALLAGRQDRQNRPRSCSRGSDHCLRLID